MNLLARLLGKALALYARLVVRTCRISGDVNREQVVLAFWHEFNLVAFAVTLARRGHLPHGSFSTRGFRGVAIGTMIESVGIPVQIIALPPETDRAASRDLSLRLSRLAQEGYSLVVTPDGPFGPYRVAKPGALIVAREAGLPIQPWSLTVRPALRLSGRWDRQLVPLPFCRIRVVPGRQLHVAPREPLRPRLAELEAELSRVDAVAR